MGKTGAKFSDGVRHLYIPTLNKISTSLTHGLRFFLANSDNYLVNPTAISDLFEIQFYDISEALTFWASDINRLACASLETVTNIEESRIDKKFIGWNIVQYYYSAFYSAHSILKLLGFGIVQVDSQIINKVRMKAAAFGVAAPNISQGTYCVDFDVAGQKAVFYKVKRYDDSHRGLWRRFSDFLNVLSGVSVLTGSYGPASIVLNNDGGPTPLSIYSNIPREQANELASRIDDLRNSLNRNGDYNWLSSIRNTVNYSHGFGVWFPYKSYNKEYREISHLRSMCYESPTGESFEMIDDHELLLFVKTCQLINSINIDILEDMCERNPDNKSFLKNGFFAYLNIYGPKN